MNLIYPQILVYRPIKFPLIFSLCGLAFCGVTGAAPHDIVINEIHYHPDTEFDAEFIEINPLSPPCIPPNPGFRDLPAKSKFLAVPNNPLSPPCIPPNPGFRDLSAKSKFLAVPIISHEKDWPQVKRETQQAIRGERMSRHPNVRPKKRRK